MEIVFCPADHSSDHPTPKTMNATLQDPMPATELPRVLDNSWTSYHQCMTTTPSLLEILCSEAMFLSGHAPREKSPERNRDIRPQEFGHPFV